MRIVGSRDETPAVYDSTLSPCPPSGEAIAIQPVRRATITIKGGKRTSQEEIVLACQEERVSHCLTVSRKYRPLTSLAKPDVFRLLYGIEVSRFCITEL